MHSIAIEFSPMEHATLVSLVALGIAVMQHDEERGREHIMLLTSPGVEVTAEALINKLIGPLTDHPEPIGLIS